MSDRHRPGEGGDKSGMQYEREATTRIPRWAKIVGISVIVVALLVVVMMLIGSGGGHGPGRHSGLGSAPLVSATEGHMPPGSGHG